MQAVDSHSHLPSALNRAKTRVIIVDDSALIRKLLTDVLSRFSQIEVVDVAVDAMDAREKIKRLNPDVITLDIEMPGMDGLSFLEKIMKLRPMPVVMCSTLTKKGASETLRALEIGAIDFIPKPVNEIEKGLHEYAELLAEKVISAASVKFDKIPAGSRNTDKKHPQLSRKGQKARVIAIGSSTGGTTALEAILTRLPVDSPPVVIAQHIPAGFSAAFAQRVNEHSAVRVKEAEDGDLLESGHVYIAPGGLHLEIVNRAGRSACALTDAPPVNRHKPSVDTLFTSIAKNIGKEAVAVMLTGMGKDGAEGMKLLYDKGVETIAQDKKTSLVWGMPRQAIEIGAVKHVAALDDIAQMMLDHACR